MNIKQIKENPTKYTSNFSDRFTAIMSGTMRNGNYFQNVIDSIRRDGLLPEALFPFGGNSWDEYHNPANITQEMKDKAKKILDIIDVSYEWVTDNATIPTDLKKCPVQGAIPYEAYHAIEIIAPGYQFDSYEPYVKPLPVVRYAMKIIVNIKKEIQDMKQTLTMTRLVDDGTQTLGELKYGSSTFKTLERPWKENKPNISCIPKGTYNCKYTFSPKFLKYTYEIQNVPKRSGIRIHSANFFYQLLGCIALGSSYLDINKDGKKDVIDSRITVNKLEALLGKKDFTLIIK